MSLLQKLIINLKLKIMSVTEMVKMKRINLVLPESIHRQIKTKASAEGITIKELLIKTLIDAGIVKREPYKRIESEY